MKDTRRTAQQRALWLALALLLGTGIGANAQTADALLSQAEAAIRKASADELAPHLNETVELTIGSKDESYSATQAKFVLNEFFRSNPVKSFTWMHRGNNGGTYYAVGAYVTQNGQTYDTNIFVKKVGSAFVIEQIRFEADL